MSDEAGPVRRAMRGDADAAAVCEHIVRCSDCVRELVGVSGLAAALDRAYDQRSPPRGAALRSASGPYAAALARSRAGGGRLTALEVQDAE